MRAATADLGATAEQPSLRVGIVALSGIAYRYGDNPAEIDGNFSMVWKL